MYPETNTAGGWAQPADTTPNSIAHALQRIDQINSLAHAVLAQVSGTADRLVGSRPEADSQKGPSSVRGGQVGGVHDQLDMLETTIQSALDQATRLGAA